MHYMVIKSFQAVAVFILYMVTKSFKHDNIYTICGRKTFKKDNNYTVYSHKIIQEMKYLYFVWSKPFKRDNIFLERIE